MGNIVRLDRRPAEAEPVAVRPAPLAASAGLYAAGVAAACWWATAWFAAFGLGLAATSPDRTKPASAPRLRLVVDNSPPLERLRPARSRRAV